MFTSVNPFTLSVRLCLDEILLQVLDSDFILSEGETSDMEGDGISSYLGDSIINSNTVLSMDRVVSLDQPSSEAHVAIVSDFMNGEEHSWRKKALA